MKALRPNHFSSIELLNRRSWPLIRCYWNARDSQRTASSEPSQRTLRVLHVVNGEHYAGRRARAGFAGAASAGLRRRGDARLRQARRFAESRRSQATPLINLPMRCRFDVRPAWRLAKIVRSEQLRSDSHPHSAGGLDRPVRRAVDWRAAGASRARPDRDRSRPRLDDLVGSPNRASLDLPFCRCDRGFLERRRTIFTAGACRRIEFRLFPMACPLVRICLIAQLQVANGR